MSVITFEDFPSSQSKETLLPQKKYVNGHPVLNKEITIPNDLPDINTDSNPKITLPLPKPTGNTPRFGSVNRAESLKPLKQRPATLLTKFSDSMTEDQSPQVTSGAKEVGKSFEVYNTGTESPSTAILSPSHQRRVETGSAGNSPKRKPYSLKHPLISRKSPLFKKFGFSPGVIGQKNVSVLNVSAGENQSSDKHTNKGNSPNLGSEMINIQNRTNLNQMIERRNEGKRTSVIEPNQFLHISLTNVDKASDNPSLSSGNKDSNTPQSYIHARASAELYSSEPLLFSEPSMDRTSHALNASKVKVNNVKENFPAIKVITENKSPQLYPLRGKGPMNNVNNRLLSANSSLANTKPPKAYPEDESLHQRIVLGSNKGLTTLDARKKNIPYSSQKMRSGNKTAFVSIKDDSINESFNSLELSAIVQETNDRDFLNMSKDDGILQYIDKDEVIEGDPRKITYNPPYIPKQMGHDANKPTEDSSILKEMRKTNSTNHIEALEPVSQNKKSVVHDFPFKFKKGSKVLAEAKPQRASSHNPYLSGGKRVPMKSRMGDDSFTQHSHGNYDTRSYYIPTGNHDRNSSMYEMPKQHEGRMLFHPEDNEPLEALRQRRVESALTKPSESYFGEYQGDPSKGPVQVPNSEKNNLKHFQFVLSPSSKQANTEEESKKIYKRVYLQGKPHTSGPMSRGYAKYKRLNVPSRSDAQNGNFAFNSVGHTQASLNDSTGNETFETSLIDKSEARRIMQKPDSAYAFARRENIGKLGPNPGEFNMQKLRDEIKKLQVKDQESQMKIAKLNMQLDNQNKNWEKKYEYLENQWKHKLTQQKQYYEKSFGSNNTSKKVPIGGVDGS